MEKALTLTQDPRQKADLQENLDRMKILIALRTRPPASKGRKP